MADTRTALEAALAASPRDPAAHAAYADFLIEHGDPRGEYIRLQLLLDDRDQPADRLRAVEQQAFELRREHEPEWLGPLYPFVAQAGPSVGAMVAEPVTVTWRRGWVYSVEVLTLTRPVAEALRDCPAARLLSRLNIQAAEYQGNPLGRLGDAIWTDAVRRLSFGRFNNSAMALADRGLPRLVRRCRRLRRLTYRDAILPEAARVFSRMPRGVMVLRVDTLGRIPVNILGFANRVGRLHTLFLDNSRPSPDDERSRGRINEPDELAILFAAAMPVLRRLTLRLRSFGDGGVEELLRSGLVNRLEALDLQRCDITDEGAELLAASPAVRALKRVRLDNNLFSSIGVQALRDVGIRAGRQGFDPWAGDEDVF